MRRRRSRGGSLRRSGDWSTHPGWQGQAIEEVLDAALTMVAAGRSGRAARWLEELGYSPPAEEHQNVDLMYVTCRLKIAAGTLGKIWTLLVGRCRTGPQAWFCSSRRTTRGS